MGVITPDIPPGDPPTTATGCREFDPTSHYTPGLRKWSTQLCQPVRMAATVIRPGDEGNPVSDEFLGGRYTGYVRPCSMDPVRSGMPFEDVLGLEQLTDYDLSQGSFFWGRVLADDRSRYQIDEFGEAGTEPENPTQYGYTIYVRMPFDESPSGRGLLATNINLTNTLYDSPRYQWLPSVGSGMRGIYFVITEAHEALPWRPTATDVTVEVPSNSSNTVEPCKHHWGRFMYGRDGYVRAITCSMPGHEPEAYISALNAPGDSLRGGPDPACHWLAMIHSPFWTDAIFYSHLERCHGAQR